jgi:hypothetical protein
MPAASVRKHRQRRQQGTDHGRQLIDVTDLTTFRLSTVLSRASAAKRAHALLSSLAAASSRTLTPDAPLELFIDYLQSTL